MNKLLVFSLILLSYCLTLNGYADNYYFSSVSGNDSNSGTSSTSAKASLNAIKSTLSSLVAGDTIFLERGSVWYQAYLIISGKEGTAENPIVFSPYGSGANPVLSGQKVLTSPTKEGHVYTFNDSSLPFIVFTEKSYGRRFPGYVTVEDKPYLPSRYPNKGYLTASSTNRISVTDNTKSWAENQWIDGWVAVKSVKWEWSVVRVTGNSPTKLNTTDHGTVPFGPKPYYILNAYDAMDQHGEWFSKEGSFSIYWTDGDLPEVKVSTVDRIITLNNSSYIQFKNIDLVGANIACVKVTNGDYNRFDHCRMIGSGEFGVYIYGAPSGPTPNGNTENTTITYCEIADCGSAAIYTRYARGGIFTNNYIHRVAINAGYQNIYDSSTGDGAYAVFVWNNTTMNSTYPIVEYNLFDSVPGGVTNHYNGYLFSMRGNMIRNYGMGDISDLGGFYSTTDSYSLANKKKIYRNFFLDVHEPDPSSQMNLNSDSYIHAIYPDQDIYGVKMDSNTVENSDLAINTNGGVGRTFNYNNFLNPGIHYHGAIRNSYLLSLIGGAKASADTMMHNNIVLGQGDIGYVFLRGTSSYGCVLPWKGEIDHNKWFNPTGGAAALAKIYDGYNDQYEFNFEQWQAFSETCDDDENNPGVNSTYNDNQYSEVRMFKNWSATEHTFFVDASYVDVDGNTIEDSIVVEPFYSKILFQVSGTESQADIYLDSTLVPAPVAVAPAELVVSSRELSKENLNINFYPVPVKSSLVVENLPEDIVLEGFDIIGHNVFNARNGKNDRIHLNMSHLRTGVYTFRIIDCKSYTQLYSFKIIKE